MKYVRKLETVLISIISVLCAILLYNLFRKLRTILPWRVNCWFCNYNVWVTFPYRNCWTCSKCDQYNGFTKDGDYNKQLFTPSEQAFKTPRVSNRSPPKNGLCKMCNINQQLKVAQLANFVPMHETRFDEEIESYRLQLEKAYKLCNPCKKIVQMKLHREKEALLGTKVLAARTPEKKNHKSNKPNQLISKTINTLSWIIAIVLLILVFIDCYSMIMSNNNFSATLLNVKEIITSLLERVYTIIEMKTLMEFPSLENYLNDVANVTNFKIDIMPDILIKKFSMNSFDQISSVAQEALGGIVCFLQILGHVFNINKLKHAIAIDLLFTIFVISCLTQHSNAVFSGPISICFTKLYCLLGVLTIYKLMKDEPGSKGQIRTPRNLKNLVRTMNSMAEEGDSSAMESDDDVSLSQYGLRGLTDSSRDTLSPNNSGRVFSPRNHDGLWTRPKLNSTFCVNSVMSNNSTFCANSLLGKSSTFCASQARKSPSSVSDTIFIKPSFRKYQKLARDDSDSELDESIGSLCLGSPCKRGGGGGSVFSLRTFTATPRLAAGARPLLSPSKLAGSWVAGGYWGGGAEGPGFASGDSRSSSQSSGFESQASSSQRHLAEPPPPERAYSDAQPPPPAPPGCRPQRFTRVNSPVYPQMQYDAYVHMPRARPAPAQARGYGPPSPFAHTDAFKAPGGYGIIKLPQTSSFSQR